MFESMYIRILFGYAKHIIFLRAVYPDSNSKEKVAESAFLQARLCIGLCICKFGVLEWMLYNFVAKGPGVAHGKKEKKKKRKRKKNKKKISYFFNL